MDNSLAIAARQAMLRRLEIKACLKIRQLATLSLFRLRTKLIDLILQRFNLAF